MLRCPSSRSSRASTARALKPAHAWARKDNHRVHSDSFVGLMLCVIVEGETVEVNLPKELVGITPVEVSDAEWLLGRDLPLLMLR